MSMTIGGCGCSDVCWSSGGEGCIVVCLCVGSKARWDCAQYARRVMNRVGMLFLLADKLCISIVGCHMRPMSGVRHLIAVQSALSAELGLRGLSAFVCDGIDPGLRLE